PERGIEPEQQLLAVVDRNRVRRRCRAQHREVEICVEPPRKALLEPCDGRTAALDYLEHVAHIPASNPACHVANDASTTRQRPLALTARPLGHGQSSVAHQVTAENGMSCDPRTELARSVGGAHTLSSASSRLSTTSFSSSMPMLKRTSAGSIPTRA